MTTEKKQNKKVIEEYRSKVRYIRESPFRYPLIQDDSPYQCLSGDELYSKILQCSKHWDLTYLQGYITISRTTDGLQLEGPTVHTLESLYTHLLSMTRDTHLRSLGVESLVGIDRCYVRWARNDCMSLRPTDTVESIMSIAIRYLAWFIEEYKLTYRTTGENEELIVPYSMIVEFIGSTLGLSTLRHILVGLLSYVEYTTSNPIEGTEDENYRRKLQYSTELADYTAKIVEDYLEKHTGEDESVKTLLFGQIACKILY